MKEFITAAESQAAAEEDREDVVEFSVDGVLCRAFKPGGGQLGVLMAATSGHQPPQVQIAGIINFFNSTLDDQSSSYLVNKLLERDNGFEIEEVQDILEYLVEEWTGRPTKSPSGSTRSQSRGGRKSTQPISASTS